MGGNFWHFYNIYHANTSMVFHHIAKYSYCEILNMKLIKNEVNKKANREREKEKKERKKPHSKLKTNQPYLETLK